MYNYEKLIKTISAGNFTLFLNGEKHIVSGENSQGTLGGIHWRINSRDKGRFTELSLTLTNTSTATVSIGDITLFSHTEDDIHGNLNTRIIYDFRNSLGDNAVLPVTAGNRVFNNCPMFLVTDGQQTFLAAQMTYNSNEIHFHSHFASSGQLECVTCDLATPPCPLPPNTSFTTDAVAIYHIQIGDPLDVLFAWADDVREANHPNLPDQTWGGFGPGTLIKDPGYTVEQKVIDQIENIGVLPKLGVKYVWISISNLLGALPGNWLYPNDTAFPHGLHTILDKIKASGLVPGFWLNPFAIAQNAIDFPRMEPFLIRNQDGTPASRGKWLFAAPDADGDLPNLFALDPKYPEVFDYIHNVLKTYASWGIRYYMIDFLEDGRYRKGEISDGYALENYLKFVRRLQEFAAPDTHFLSATGSSVVHIGAVSSSRIGMDYCEGRALHKHWPSYPATYVIGGSIRSCGAPNRNAINNMAVWAFADRAFFRCNSNMMTVDKPIPLNEARITASLYGISSSPVFFGDHFKMLDPERLALVKKVLPRGKEMPLPVDLFTKTDLDNDFVRIFRLEVRKPWGTYALCAIFNLNESVRTLTLSDKFLRIPTDRDYVMYDFWNEEYIGTFRHEFTVDVPRQSATVLRLEEKHDHPWLLSTDMTVRQGDAEITDLKWDAKSLCLRGTARRATGESGNLFFIAPDRFKVVNDNKGVLVAKSARDMSLIIKKHIYFVQDTAEFQINFEMWEGTDAKISVEK